MTTEQLDKSRPSICFEQTSGELNTRAGGAANRQNGQKRAENAKFKAESPTNRQEKRQPHLRITATRSARLRRRQSSGCF